MLIIEERSKLLSVSTTFDFMAPYCVTSVAFIIHSSHKMKGNSIIVLDQLTKSYYR